MTDWNRTRRQEYGDQDRNYRRDRQPQQFQNDRSYSNDDYSGGYGQMGEDYSRGRYGGQQDEAGYLGERSAGSWRDDRSGGRSRSYGASGGYGSSQSGMRGQFGSDSYRGSGMGDMGSNRDRAYGRSNTGTRGDYGYGSGSFNAGAQNAGTAGMSGSGYDAGRYGDADERGFFARASDEVASWFSDEDAERRRREIDHRGRGPSSYKRSDERILEDACDRLTEDYGVDARNIQVTVSNGEVTLDGTVDDRRQKRRAEDVVHEVSGVGHVQNNLRAQQSSRNSDNPSTDAYTQSSQTSERTSGTLA